MERIWLSRYPADVPAEINPDHYPSLLEMIEKAVAEHQDRIAFINTGHTLTYRQLDDYSRAFANWLQQEQKLVKGERVALMLPNLLQYPVALFGILRAGLVVVNVNPLYTPRELTHQLQDCAASLLITATSFAHSLEKVIPNTAITRVVLTEPGDLFPAPKRTLVNFIVKYVKRLVPQYDLPHTIAFRDVLQRGQRLRYQRPTMKGSDLAFLQYTGGTTGVAKGAMLTHRNILACLEQAKAAYLPALNGREELIVTALPLYHIFALVVNCLLFIEIGGRNLLNTDPRDIDRLVRDMAQYRFTAITGVNTLFNALLAHIGFRQLDFSALHLTVGGGMPVQASTAEAWYALTGCQLLEGYGLTECSPLVTANPYNLTHYNGSIGLPVSSTRVRLVDDQDREVPPGEAGELCVQGPQVMAGYWQQPQETARVLRDGWLHTGDIAIMDEQGFLYIVDRKKDMILVSGFNVYPHEIETVIARHPQVEEVAVVGVPGGPGGEIVRACVVRKTPELTGQALIAWCRHELTGYKVPAQIIFYETLPKTSVGKILRRQLRQNAGD